MASRQKFLYKKGKKGSRKVVESSEKPKITQHKDLMSLGFKDSELRLLLKNKYDGKSLDFIDEYYNKYKFENDSITTSLYTDIKVVVEGDMMTKMNETSNLSGLETISPLLAKEIIELSAKIPSNYKINNKSQKIILKETFKDIIPKEIFKAPKSGFGVPIGQWLQKELKNEMLELLSEIIIKEQGIFNYDHIKNIIKEHLSNEKNRSGELWTLFVFQKWYLKHLND